MIYVPPTGFETSLRPIADRVKIVSPFSFFKAFYLIFCALHIFLLEHTFLSREHSIFFLEHYIFYLEHSTFLLSTLSFLEYYSFLANSILFLLKKRIRGTILKLPPFFNHTFRKKKNATIEFLGKFWLQSVKIAPRSDCLFNEQPKKNFNHFFSSQPGVEPRTS